MGEKLVNGGLFLLSILYTYFARGYSFGSPTAPKVGFLPQLVGYCAIVISGYLLVRSLMGKGDAQNVKLRCDYKRLGLLVLSMVVYILIFKPVGYLISTAALLYAAMKIGNVKGWKIPAAVSVLTSVFFFLVFKVFLAVPLPAGLLF